MTRKALACALLVLSACAPPRIAFDALSYPIGTPKVDAAIIAVIEPQELERGIEFRSVNVGEATIEPGRMLQQVADVELPQLCTHYEDVTSYRDIPEGRRGVTLVLTVPNYEFRDFRAFVTVRARAYGPGRRPIFDATYAEQGDAQGGKMFFGGPFALKSTVRASSLAAYKRIFVRLRADLVPAMASGPMGQAQQ